MRLESHGLCWHNSQPTEFWWLSPRNQMKLTSQPAHFQPRLLHLGAAALPGRGNCISKFPELAELMLPSKTTLKMEDAKLQLQAESEPEPLHACPRLELPSGFRFCSFYRGSSTTQQSQKLAENTICNLELRELTAQ